MRTIARITIVGAAGIAIVLSAFVSTSRAQSASKEQQKAAPARVSPEEATSAARAWLHALQARDVGKLAEKTQFPFTYKTTSRRKLCEGTAVNARNLASTVDCLIRREKLLLEELAHAQSVEVKTLDSARAPRWVVKLIGRPASGDRLVTAFVNGDGITFEFVFVVLPGATGSGVVKRFLVNAELISG
jgi:hypothetical protein